MSGARVEALPFSSLCYSAVTSVTSKKTVLAVFIYNVFDTSLQNNSNKEW